jgi:hypothetical protein
MNTAFRFNRLLGRIFASALGSFAESISRALRPRKPPRPRMDGGFYYPQNDLRILSHELAREARGDTPLICRAMLNGHLICILEYGHVGSHEDSNLSRHTEDDLLRARVRELREKARGVV